MSVRIKVVKGKITAEILGHKIRDLLDLEKPGKGKLRLTTSDDYQESGKLRVYLERDEERIFLKEIIIRNIPRAGAGEPDIDVVGEYTADKTLNLSVYLNGKPYTQTEIDLRPYAKRKKTLVLVLLPLAILLIIGLLFQVKGRLFSRVRITGQREQKTLVAPGRQAGEEPAAGAAEDIQAAGAGADLQAAGAPGTEKKTETPGEEMAMGEKISEEVTATAETKTEEPAAGTAEDMQAAGAGADLQAAGPPGTEEKTETQGEEMAMGEKISEEVTAAAETKTEETAAGAEPEAPAAYLEQTVTIYFTPESSILTAPARERLEEILPFLLENPSRPVTINGHCALYDSEASREKLSLERAAKVAGFFRQRGWKPDTEPKVRGFGGKEPVTRNWDEQHLNRRVEIILERL